MSATVNVPFETLTLVPPTLTDGSFYLTVWGLPPFTATLTNTRPVITPVDYSFIVTNNLPVSLDTWLVTSNAWTPNTSTNWPIGAQVSYNSDWTGFTSDASGASEQGHFFFASQGNPLQPGAYYVGVVNGNLSTAEMDYDLLARGIFPNGTVADVPFVGSNSVSGLATHRVVWSRVMVPINAPGWDLGLDVGAGDGFFVFRKDGLPNYGVMSGSGSSPTNLVGCLVRKTGDEHFLLLPNPPDTNVIAGTSYFGVVSEGQNASGTRAGSNFCSFTFASEGPLTPANLGTVDPLGQTGLVTQATQDGGEILGYQFSVLPNTPVFEVRLTNRVANPWMSLRADAQYGDPYDPAYGNLGGWAARWSDSSVIRVPWPVAGVYTLLVQAASFNGQYTNTSYTLQVAAQSALTPAFDGGTTVITNQPADGWNYFLIRVPPDALGWDLRLTNIITGSPRLVVCRAGWPYDLTSRFTNGTAWAWGAATNWPVGAQAAPGIDSSGYRYETNRYDSSGTNLVDTTGTVFAAGMGSPLEPGNYIIGVSSAPGGGHKFQKGGGENALLGELNGQTNVPPGTITWP